MKNTKLLFTLGIIIIIVIGLSIKLNQKPKDTSDIMIGSITALSGDAAPLGEFIKNVTDMAVEKVNANGGIDGRKLSVIWEDSQCDTKKAVSSFQKLINNDKVKIVIGSTCSGDVSAFLPIAKQNNILVVSGAATSPSLTGVSDKFVRTISSDANQGRVIAEYAIDKGYKKVVILQETADYTSSIVNSFSEFYTKDKGDTYKEEFLSNSNDLRTQISKLKSESPDLLLLLPNSPATIDKMAKILRDLKWNTQIVGVDMFGSGTDPLVKNKDVWEGMLVAQQNQATESEDWVKFRQEYEKRFGKKLIYEFYAQAQYDLIDLLNMALINEGENADKLSAWLKKVNNYHGFSGDVSIDSKGDRVGGHVLKVIKDGVAVDIK